MIRICKSCKCEFEDFNYIKGKDSEKICPLCRIYLSLAMDQDDYSIYEKYLNFNKFCSCSLV